MKTLCAVLLGMGLLLSGPPGPLLSAFDADRAHDGKAWAASTFARMPGSGASPGASGSGATGSRSSAGQPRDGSSGSPSGNQTGGGSSAGAVGNPSGGTAGNAAHKENALSERLEGMKKMSDDLME